MGASRACRSDDDHDGDSLHAPAPLLERTLLRPLWYSDDLRGHRWRQRQRVIMPALFVDGTPGSELGLFSQ